MWIIALMPVELKYNSFYELHISAYTTYTMV